MNENTHAYVSEIRRMMFGYGDCKDPSLECAEMIEYIVLQQMHCLLVRLAEISELRGGKNKIGHEDILFLMRQDRVKLHRLLKYMEFKDLKTNVTGGDDDLEKPVDAASEDLLLDFKPKPKPKKSRVSKCLAFLEVIDQTGELYNVLQDNELYDEEKHARLLRHNDIALSMSSDAYFEYEEARKAGFKNATKFENWIYNNSFVEKKPTKLALEMIMYLAQQTVAKVVDVCLDIKQERVRVFTLQCFHANEVNNPTKMALPNIPQCYGDHNALPVKKCSNKLKAKNLNRIIPEDIWKALRHFHEPKRLTPISDVCSSTHMKLFCI